MLKAALPPLSRSGIQYPLVLSGHSAFHTPLMQPMARALQQRAPAIFSAPSLPLVDGAGRVWAAHTSAEETDAMRRYTTDEQAKPSRVSA